MTRFEMFDRIRPGAPWWFWFRHKSTTGMDPRDLHVLKVLRDGSGNLWTDIKGHGMKVDILLESCDCLGAISEEITECPTKK